MKWANCIFAVALGLAAAAPIATATVTTIWEIQMGAFQEGDEVTVENVVVTGSGRFGFFVQETSPHPLYQWMNSGIWVYTDGAHLGIVQRGTLVNVTGAYAEYFDFSEIDIIHDPCGTGYECSFEVVGTGTVPDPVEVAITDVNNSGPFAEAYESVLIKVDIGDDQLWAGQPDSYGEWWLFTDGVHMGDSLHVESYSSDPQGDFDYELPDEGDMITFVAGILTYSYSSYKIAPRDCEGDLGMDCPPNLRGMWAYDNAQVDVYFAVDVEQASAEDVANYEFDSGLDVLAATRDATNYRMVHLTTAAQTPGTVDIGYVYEVLSTQGVQMADGEYTFTQGITPIYDIQHVTDPLLDDSPYMDIVVTTAGRVAFVEGNYYFLQEGDAGPYKHLYGRVAASGELAVGDSIKFAGRVREYFGSTQVSWTPGVVLWENLGVASGPVIVSDVNAADIIYNCDAGDMLPPDTNVAEPWEHGLIRLNEPAYVDSVDGESALYGEWWLLVEADSARTDLTNEINDFGANVNYTPTVGDTIKMSGILFYEYGIYHIIPRDTGDIEIIFNNGAGVDEIVDAARMMLRNNPNPFALRTAISFRLNDKASDVSIEIFDVNGALVRTLLRGQTLPAGDHQAHWNGLNNERHPVGAGAYFYRLSVDGRSHSKQMLMLK